MNVRSSFLSSIKRVCTYLSRRKLTSQKSSATAEERKAWLFQTLSAHKYALLPRDAKGALRQHIERKTGYSRSQVTRLIAEYRRQSAQDSAESDDQRPASFNKFMPWVCAAFLLLSSALGLARSTTAAMGEDPMVFLNDDVVEEVVLNDANDDVFAMRRAIEQGSTVMTQSVVTTRENENGLVEAYPLFVAQAEIAPVDEQTAVRRRTHALDTETLWQKRAERKAERLARLPAESSIFSTEGDVNFEPVQSTLHASAFSLIDVLGTGETGQILMFKDGRAQWQDLGDYAQTRSGRGRKPHLRKGGSGHPSAGDESGSTDETFGGGGSPRRFGGGGGGGGSSTTTTTTTTTIQNITNNTTINNITSGSGANGIFVGNSSVTSYTGAFSSGSKIGYDAANSICNSNYAGSHYCRTDEILSSIATQDIGTLFSGVGDAWIAEGPPGFTANSNDCNGWTNSGATYLGAWWDFSTSGGGAGYLTNCSTTKPVACCR